MDVKDVLGLGKILPLEKLVDVVSAGVGRLTKNYFTKAEIDLKAYEIRKLASAKADEIRIIGGVIDENPSLKADLNYGPSGVELNSKQVDRNRIPLAEVENRSLQRSEFQQIKKQINLESITAIAAEELKLESEVTNAPLDEDWISRFFSIAEDVSSEEMQQIWGKILAGEIKKPSSYSLRALELLRSMSKEEAEIFQKVSNFAISSYGKNFVHKIEGGKLFDNFGIKYEDIATLIEIGILQSGTLLQATIDNVRDSDQDSIFTYGEFVIRMTLPPKSKGVNYMLYPYTTAGNELLNLTAPTTSLGYLTAFLDVLSRPSTVVHYGKIEKFDGERYFHKDLTKYEKD